jgi:hypothetical protein
MDGYHTLGWETFRLSCLLVWGVMAMAMMRWSRIELDLVRNGKQDTTFGGIEVKFGFGTAFWHDMAFFLDGYNQTL